VEGERGWPWLMRRKRTSIRGRSYSRLRGGEGGSGGRGVAKISIGRFRKEREHRFCQGKLCGDGGRMFFREGGMDGKEEKNPALGKGCKPTRKRAQLVKEEIAWHSEGDLTERQSS